jgi:hypothetical protein
MRRQDRLPATRQYTRQYTLQGDMPGGAQVEGRNAEVRAGGSCVLGARVRAGGRGSRVVVGVLRGAFVGALR